MSVRNYKKKPDWLRIKVNQNDNLTFIEDLLKKRSLNTVCNEAMCPNRGECYSKKTATFIVLGKVCTRNCTFCTVTKGKTETPDINEPGNIALAVKEMGLRHVVITSVTRDDLADGGSAHFAEIINRIKESSPSVIIEVLIPDFRGNEDALRTVIDAAPDIINHNMETVKSLYDEVRPQAKYEQSLELLKRVKEIAPEIVTKSGIMLGLGETADQIFYLLKDLREVECQILTIGQYLAPSEDHHEVVEYIHPDKFEEYKRLGEKLGFLSVASSPLVRSSYNAEEMYNLIERNKKV
ncbi:MAG: lipoyl synthase [Spirochaetaceae bacterium]